MGPVLSGEFILSHNSMEYLYKWLQHRALLHKDTTDVFEYVNKHNGAEYYQENSDRGILGVCISILKMYDLFFISFL